MVMLNVRLDEKTENVLNQLAKETLRTKSQVARTAILMMAGLILNEFIESVQSEQVGEKEIFSD